MRHLFWFCAGCAGISYEVASTVEVPVPCVAVGEYRVCDEPLPFQEAYADCVFYGGALVDATDPPDPKAEQDYVAALGEELLTTSYAWWVGWPANYPCPTMTRFGGSSPGIDCDEFLPYICEATP